MNQNQSQQSQDSVYSDPSDEAEYAKWLEREGRVDGDTELDGIDAAAFGELGLSPGIFGLGGL